MRRSCPPRRPRDVVSPVREHSYPTAAEQSHRLLAGGALEFVPVTKPARGGRQPTNKGLSSNRAHVIAFFPKAAHTQAIARSPDLHKRDRCSQNDRCWWCRCI